MQSDAQLVSSEFPTGVQLGSDQETKPLLTPDVTTCSKTGAKNEERIELQPSHRDVRSTTDVNTSNRSVSWWEGLKKISMQVHCSHLKMYKVKLGWLFYMAQYAVHCRGLAAWMSSTEEASPKAQAQKGLPRLHQGPWWHRWRLLRLYTVDWWDKDEGFWSWWPQNCMVSQRWVIQRKVHSA